MIKFNRSIFGYYIDASEYKASSTLIACKKLLEILPPTSYVSKFILRLIYITPFLLSSNRIGGIVKLESGKVTTIININKGIVVKRSNYKNVLPHDKTIDGWTITTGYIGCINGNTYFKYFDDDFEQIINHSNIKLIEKASIINNELSLTSTSKIINVLVNDLGYKNSDVVDAIGKRDQHFFRFGHCDIHEGNILTNKENKIIAIIDWELIGWKSDLYDSLSILLYRYRNKKRYLPINNNSLLKTLFQLNRSNSLNIDELKYFITLFIYSFYKSRQESKKYYDRKGDLLREMEIIKSIFNGILAS